MSRPTSPSTKREALPAATRDDHGWARGKSGLDAPRLGNLQTLQALGIRAKLELSTPGDADEREADRMAASFPADARAEPPSAATLSESGAPLPSPLRREYERFFNADLSSVRLFADASAARAARHVNAQAFTHRDRIYFGEGRFQPHATTGRKLLAHELAHTMQAPRASGDRIRRSPDPPAPDTSLVLVQAPRPTLDALVRMNPEGFTDPALDRAYQAYRGKESSPSDARTWALRQTSGAPRQRLEQLLGRDYARGQLTQPAAPPIDVRQAPLPPGYGLERVAQDATTLGQNVPTLSNRLQKLIETPIEGGLVSASHFRILQGNVGEVLARSTLEQALEEVRREAPDANLFFGVRARVMMKDGTLSDPVLFSDGIIAAIRPGGLQIFRVAEVKSGAEGGSEAQEQFHRWIEAHGTTEIEIQLPGVPRFFRLSDTVREVSGLATAPRIAIVPRGARFPTERSGHGVPAPVQRRELPQSAEEINFLTRMVAQQIIQMQQARALLERARATQVQPALLETADELQRPSVVRRLLAENNGTALIQGQLYRVAISGTSINARLLPAAPLSIPRVDPLVEATLPVAVAPGALPSGAAEPAAASSAAAVTRAAGALGPGPADAPAPASFSMTAPQPTTMMPRPGPIMLQGPPTSGPVPLNILNFTTSDIIVGGRTVAPTPSTSVVQAGEMIVIGHEHEWVVSDPVTQRPIAGVYQGGEWVRVLANGRVIPIDGEGLMRSDVEPMPFEVLPEFAKGENLPGAQPRSAGMRGVAGGLGLLAVASEIIGPIGKVLQSHRRNIALGHAQINFWLRFNANPTFGVWDQTAREPLPVDSVADTAVLGSPSFPYVADIDIASFRDALRAAIGSYRDLLLFLDLAKTLEVIYEEPPMPNFPSAEELRTPRRYWAFVNQEERGARIRYDITNTIEQIRDRTLGTLDTAVRARVKALPANERENIFRLRLGNESPTFRSASGNQRILSHQQLFGSDPWVHVVGPRIEGGAWRWFRYGQWRNRVLVEPANADAERASMVSSYEINRSIGDVLDEVQEGGRPIIRRDPKEGRLESFVAGPEPGVSRFGETRYYRSPSDERDKTVAMGELHQFWVNSRDLESVAAADISAYAEGAPAGAPVAHPL
jgi:hypothetical protein